MEVLSFSSTDGRIIITAGTAASMSMCWQRFSARVKENPATYCDYSSSLPGSLQLALPSDDFALSPVNSSDNNSWNGLPPVFYETALYNFSIYFTDVSEAPCVLHKLKEVSELFNVINIGPDRWLLSAPLSFLNQPGFFELKFRYIPRNGQVRTDTFSFRVVSPKLDTKYDFNHMLAEINEQYNQIVFQYLTLTIQNFQLQGKSSNDIVWLSIFRNIAGHYEKWIRFIVNKPHLRQTKHVCHDRADRIKRWTPSMYEKYCQAETEGRLENVYFRHEEIIHTHNTRENRFIKYTLDRIVKRLASIISIIKAESADKVADSELCELETYTRSIHRLSNSPLLRNLRGEPLHSESIVLQKRNGYAQVYKYWLLLQKGIDLFEGVNAVGVRPIWELYELWCFLKMRKMVAEVLRLDLTNNSEITESPALMVKPFQDNVHEHTVFYNCPDGSKVRLHYQHTFSRNSGPVHTATTENRPDIVLTIVKPDGFELTYLFDAKYRLHDDGRLNSRENEVYGLNGADTPPADAINQMHRYRDAINQMHRYRDAIYYGKDSRQHAAKEVIGAYILFPGRGNNEAISKRFFYRSIETVNIGAFPLLPDAGDTTNQGTLLYGFLTKILTAPVAYDHLKESIPQKGLKYHSTEHQVPDDIVLIGYYRTEQWEAIVKNHMYYVPVALGKGSINLISGFEKTAYLLLHHANRRLLVRIKGNGPRYFPKSALVALGFTPSEEHFLVFEIKDFTPVPGIDPYAYDLERKGKYSSTPYFTTLGRLSSGKV